MDLAMNCYLFVASFPTSHHLGLLLRVTPQGLMVFEIASGSKVLEYNAKRRALSKPEDAIQVGDVMLGVNAVCAQPGQEELLLQELHKAKRSGSGIILVLIREDWSTVGGG